MEDKKIRIGIEVTPDQFKAYKNFLKSEGLTLEIAKESLEDVPAFMAPSVHLSIAILNSPDPTPAITVGCRVSGNQSEGLVLAIDEDVAWVRHGARGTHYRTTWRLSHLTYIGPGDPPPALIPAEAQAVIDAAEWVVEANLVGNHARLRDAVRAYREAQDRGR